MNKQLVLALILCTAILCQSNSCPGFNGNDLLQSGKNAIMRGKIGGTPQYSYQAPINFMIPNTGIDIAVTTSTIGDYNPLQDYGYNYFIQADRKGKSNAILYKLIMNNDDSWTSIQLSYLVSGRSDIALGNFQVPVNQWVAATSNVYNVYYKIGKDLPKTNYKVAAFISGFSTTDSQFGLTVNRKFYTAEDKKLAITFYCSANPAVLTITITYIVYPEVHPILQFAYQLTPRGQSASYQISGPVNFQPNKRIQYNQWRVLNRNLVCTGNQCSNTCVLREECARLNGNIWESKCIFCGPGVVAQYGQCTRRCYANQQFVSRVCVCAKGFKRSGRDCILDKQCGTNQVWSDTQNKCVCNEKSTLINDQCRECPAGSSPTADGKSCFCTQAGRVFNDKQWTCKSRCNSNEQWFNGKCVCIQRHCWWNQACRRCPDNSDPSPDQSTCIPKSPNAYYNPQDNTVYQCGKDQVVNKIRSECICKDGFKRKDKVCVPDVVIPTCNKDTQVLNGNTCDCKPDFIRDGKICKPRCTVNQKWDGKECQCFDGFARYGTACRQCPAGSVPNADRTACVCTDANQVLVADKFVCAPCQGNSVPSADKVVCVCKIGFSAQNGVCVPNCKDPEVVNAQGSGCECKSGWVKGLNGLCQPVCKDPEVINAANNGCDCKAGWGKAQNGVCVPICKDPEVVNAQANGCDCKAGWARSTSGVCLPVCRDPEVINTAGNGCECKFGWGKVGATCLPVCKDPEVINGAKDGCDCKQGWARNNGRCQPVCRDPEVVNAQATGCECRSGWSRNTKGVCQPVCNDPEVLNAQGNACDCKFGWARPGGVAACQPLCLVNQVWNGNSCDCVSGYGLSAGVCRQCPVGSVNINNNCVCTDGNQFLAVDKWQCLACYLNSIPTADKTGCVCKLGFVPKDGACVPDCRDPEVLSVITGQCECKSGYTKNTNGKCETKCGPGQTWDGVNCLCPEGTAKYGTCKKCPAGSLPNALRTACICTDFNQIFQSTPFACSACPANSQPSADLSKCVCKEGLTSDGTNCVLKCGANEVPNYTTLRCECIFGYHKPADVCVARCGKGEEYNGVSCVCKPGFGLWNKVCTDCPADSLANPTRTSCKCVAQGYIFNPTTFKCEKCPDYSTNSDDGTKCECINGYEQNGNYCSPKCDVNEELDAKTNSCDCKYGFLRLGPMCVERCGLNHEWTGKDCRCKENHIKQTGACRPCPDGTETNPSRTTCICKNNKHIFDFDRFSCVECPPFSAPSVDFSDFICFPGYKKEGKSCINTCPEGASPDSLGHCVCGGGFYLEGKVCKKPVACPSRSTWNANSLECVCDTKGEHIIDSQCKPCGENAVYSAKEKKCICSTGFFLIGGECTVCDPRTRYNGTDCVCNLGYFGTRDKCEKCHGTCAVCSGPEANQCQACSDVSLILQNSFCSKNNPCDPGFWLDQNGDKVCKKCTDNCIICDDIFQCQQCALGYEIQKFEIGGQTVDACVEICGDGIRYEAECDDGNTVDGDGCSSSCNKQPGWECTGGSSSQKSSCNKYIPDRSVLISKGTVNLGDRVVQSVRASYLPVCLTQNECSKCFKSLKVNVVDANVPILVTVNYIPFSQYQFLIEYNFQGLYVTSRFKTVIKFSEEFRGCLTDDDFDEQLELSIDPAFLAKVNVEQALTLDEIQPAKPGQQKPIKPLPAQAQAIVGVKP